MTRIGLGSPQEFFRRSLAPWIYPMPRCGFHLGISLVPPEVDTYVIGIWDTSAEAWKEGDVHFYYKPKLTDDGSGIYVINQAQVRQMFSVIQKAARQQNQRQALNVGMFAENDDSISFGGVRCHRTSRRCRVSPLLLMRS